MARPCIADRFGVGTDLVRCRLGQTLEQLLQFAVVAEREVEPGERIFLASDVGLFRNRAHSLVGTVDLSADGLRGSSRLATTTGRRRGDQAGADHAATRRRANGSPRQPRRR